MLVPYLDNQHQNNPSKEAISESSQIKEHHDTRLLNEQVRMLQYKHLNWYLDNELNRPVHEKLLISDKSRLFYTVY